MTGLGTDIRYCIRLFTISPVSSAFTILVMAIAMTFVTAFLSLWNDISLRPHSGLELNTRLITLGQTDGVRFSPLSFELIERISREATSIDAIAGVMTTTQFLQWSDQRIPVETELVTGHFFSALRPDIQIGRNIDRQDHQVGSEPVVVLSYDYWQSQFGGRDDVLGESVTITGPDFLLVSAEGTSNAAEHGQTYRIVGVLSQRMPGTFGNSTAIWMPYEQAANALFGGAGNGYRRLTHLRTVARPSGNASAISVREELNSRYLDSASESGLRPDHRIGAIQGVVRDINVHREIARQVRLFLMGSMMLAAVAACNVGLFLLSRAPRRQSELAIRLAVGASFRRLARQLAIESGVLVVVSSALGVVGSLWCAVFLSELPFFEQAEWRSTSPWDWRVLGMITCVSLAFAVIVSLAPVVSLRHLGTRTRSWIPQTGAGLAQHATGTIQIVVTATLAGVALIYAWHMTSLSLFDPGVDVDVHVIGVNPFGDELAIGVDADTIMAHREHQRDVIGSLPGIEAVAFGSAVPGAVNDLVADIHPADSPRDSASVVVVSSDPSYPSVLGISLRYGRGLTTSDRDSVLVNETVAQELWGRMDVVGESIGWRGGVGASEIVGVLSDVAYGHPSEAPRPMVYRLTTALSALDSVLVRGAITASDIRRLIQVKIDEGELNFNIQNVQQVEELWNRMLGPDRARTAVTGVSAILVVVLACLGLYATQYYLVFAGRREYAIRAALGCGPTRLGRLVMSRSLIMSFPGLVVGTLGTFIVTTWLRDELLSSTVSPLIVSITVAIVMAILVLIATITPARSAKHTDPSQLLRD